MKLLRILLFKKFGVLFLRYLALLLACALGQFGILLLIHLSIASLDNPDTNRALLLGSAFALLIACLFFAYKAFFRSSQSLFGKSAFYVRQEMTQNLLKASLQDVEGLEPQKIQRLLLGNTAQLLESNGFLSNIFVNLAITWISLGYLAFINPYLMLFLTPVYVWGLFFFYRKTQANDFLEEKASESANQATEELNGLLKGFKALQLNKKKKEAYVGMYRKQAAETEHLKMQGLYEELQLSGSFNILFFLFLILSVLILSQTPISSDDFSAVVSGILFLMPPFFNSFSYIGRLNAFKLMWLEVADVYEVLASSATETLPPPTKQPLLKKGIQLNNLQFRYGQKGDYRFGPVNLDIKQGELIFIVGGNGSGKSTLLKLLTGLYMPTAGSITFDGKQLTKYTLPAYKDFFSLIFTDFHLFKCLYGIENPNEQHLKYLLDLMDLSVATSYGEEGFSKLELSSGQKKRLAMLVAFMENKPVYVLDEVAADQDPGYRRFFYHTVLPELKKAGKTILVVSHDEHYFHVADKIVHLENGKITHISQKQ